jgi:hemolysin activation/secretion protein
VGGTSSGNYTTSPEKASKTSMEIMAEYRKTISDNFQLGIGIGYQRHGEIKRYTDVEDANLKVDVKETKLYDSIPIYVTARYEFNKDGNIIPFIKANAGYSFNINRKNTNYYETINKNTGDIIDSDYLRHFTAKSGIYYSLGVGIGYKNFTFDVSYNVNTAKIESTNYLGQKNKGKGDYSRILFSLGYQYRFNNSYVPDYARNDRRKIFGKNKKTETDKVSLNDTAKENKENKKDYKNIKNNSVSNNIILKDELPKEQRDFYSGEVNNENSTSQNERPDTTNLPKFYIHTIYVSDELSLIKDKEKYKIIEQYENKELTVVDIRELGKKLNDEYLKAGYVTTRVMLPQQDINSGILQLAVVYGRIEEIILDDDTNRDRRKIFFAFNSGTGDVLNVKDTDHGIDNMNRLESNDVKMDIVPGDNFGYSKIIVKSNKAKKWRIKLGYDNTEENKEKIRTTIEFDDILGLNDSFYAYYKTDFKNLGKSKKNKNNTDTYSLGYSFPVKTWEISLNYSYSDEKTMNTGLVSTYEIQTKTKEYSLNIGKMLYRSNNVKLKLDLGIAIKNENTFIDSIRLESQERKFAVANVGISGILRLFGGMSSYNLTYYRGLSALGAKSEGDMEIGVMTESTVLSSDKKYQFDKIYGSFSWYRPFSISKQRFTFRTSVAGQYTEDNLFSSERISIGGFDTIRGYSHNISGDIGFYTRTEVSYILPKMTKSEMINNFLFKLRPYVAFDYGKIRDNFDDNGDRHGKITTASGYGAGVRYYGNLVNVDAGVIMGDKNLDGIGRDKYRSYVTASITF